jgi:aminopeptidase N
MVNGQPATIQPDPVNIDIVKLVLPSPLFPVQKIQITTPFYVKLPSYFSRSGYDEQQYMICQWYPKPAVYDSKGWHAIPYLDQGEFYSEFGTFKVSITVPSAYVVGATGSLQTVDELNRYKAIGAENYKSKKPASSYKPVTSNTKTLQYFAENVHDFAWFADKDFVIQYDTLQLPSGKIVDVFSYYQPNGNREWNNSIGFIEDAVIRYSDWVGEYPYPTVAAVEGPKNLSSGGMEYPMITLITSPQAKKEGLDAVITHEVGHNWFYGILASNEREHPWMDEGLNTYFQFKYEAEKYRSNSVFGSSLPDEVKKLPADEFLSRIMFSLNSLPAKAPIQTPSTDFPNKDEYGIVVYLKTAIWMSIVESSIGKENLLNGVREYFREWKFKHPYPEDLKASMEIGSQYRLDDLFELLNRKGNFK